MLRLALSSLVLVATVARAAPRAEATSADAGLEVQHLERPALALLRPPGWIARAALTDNGVQVTVTDPDGVSLARLEFIEASTGQHDAPGRLAALCRELKTHYPGLVVTRASTCRDGLTCATAAVSFQAGGVPMRGLIHVDDDLSLVSVRRIEARADRYDGQRDLLLQVLASVQLEPGPEAQAAPPLVARRSTDGSVALQLPAEWRLQAEEGKARATSPDASAGLLYTTVPAQEPGLALSVPLGVVISPVRPPEQLAQAIWERFGNRDVRVRLAASDPAAAAGCLQRFGRRCEAADLELTWLSPYGDRCTGFVRLTVVTPGPDGTWFSVVAGAWGPTGRLDEALGTLEAAAASLAGVGRPAREDLGQSLTRLRALDSRTRKLMGALHPHMARNLREHARWAEPRWDDSRLREGTSTVLQQVMQQIR